MAYSTTDILNIALVGSSGSGKTQLIDQLAASAGRITKAGRVVNNDTVSDYDPREQAAQHSITPSVCSFDYSSRHINLIDTPGFRDFFGRTLATLPAVESAALVVDAAGTIDSYIQSIFSSTAARNLCRMVIVNRIDSETADAEGIIEQLQTILGRECLPINLPNEAGDGVVNCLSDSSDGETAFDTVEDAHERLIDQIVEVDEELMELYLEEGELPEDKFHDAFAQALRDGHLVPVCFTSAESGVGVPELLDLLTRLMPNPTEGNPAPFLSGRGEETVEIKVSADSNAHVVAHVFGVTIDPFKGRLAICRVHQGTLASGGQVFVGDARKPLKVQHLFQLFGAEQIEIPEAVAGDICAIPRAEGVAYNAVLHESHDEDEVGLKAIDIPLPVYGLALKPKDDSDAQKVSDALNTISAEDPSISVDHVVALNETVLRGLGEMHLRVVLEEIAKKYDVQVDTAVPAIEYKETITSAADGHYRHKKQTGGAGQFGEVYLRIEPLPRGSGFEFVDNVVGGVIPGQFIPAVEKGIQQVLSNGAISGHEMQDIRVSVYDGKHHPVDSKEVAFVQAGKWAFMDAVGKARPIVMEPVVDVNINVPNECMGDVAGDLSSMSGMVKGSNVQPDQTIEITGQAPLRELQTYHSRLNSISGGKGSYSMEFSHYAPVQAQLQKELAAAFKPVEDA